MTHLRSRKKPPFPGGFFVGACPGGSDKLDERQQAGSTGRQQRQTARRWHRTGGTGRHL